MIRQEQYFIDHKRYAATLSDLGFPASPYAIGPDGEAVSALAKKQSLPAIDLYGTGNTRIHCLLRLNSVRLKIICVGY